MGAPNARRDRLTERELGAWRMLRAHAAVQQVLSHEMEEATGLSISEYEVLLFLYEHPDGRMAMTELASSVLLTPSGITRLVHRLVARGWVERQACPTDARRQHAVLTAAGRARFVSAGRVHLRGVRAHFLAHVTAEEQVVLSAVWDRVIASVAPHRWPSDAAPGDDSCGSAR